MNENESTGEMSKKSDVSIFFEKIGDLTTPSLTDSRLIEALTHCYNYKSKLLVRVGSETVNETPDSLLKRDMPPALEMVKAAFDGLGDAAQYTAADPFSVQGREVLIKGARGILQVRERANELTSMVHRDLFQDCRDWK